MSTCSRIGILNDDGSIRSIYCYFDGYLDGVGDMLKKHYNDPVKINKLLDLGDISGLGESCECPSGHTFDNPKKGYTVAYGRDCGESKTKSVKHSSIHDFKSYFEEYNYLYKEGQWHWCADGSKTFRTF